MRLSQLARKYDIPLQEMIEFIKAELPAAKSHPNSNADAETIAKVEARFLPTVGRSAKREAPNPISDNSAAEQEIGIKSKNEDDSRINEEIKAETTEQPDESIQIEKTGSGDVVEDQNTNPGSKEDAILLDHLPELIEKEDESPELEKIRLIKAPKKELEGLKVLGKLKPDELERRNRKRKKNPPKVKDQKPTLSEDEKEKRRLKAKKKKEAFEAKQERRAKKKERKRLKTLKEQHYKERIEQAKIHRNKHRPKKQTNKGENSTDQKAKPKTLWGKFIRWLNT